ncbi:MAG: hypothetical protein IT495_22500 [Gammaproteobacteria bacterium]|nr:hypothetical protein [Gammaproteobacteria bacterium]
MQCSKLDDVARLLDPLDAGWDAVTAQRIELTPAPLPLQPTAYIRVAWADRPYGTVPELQARAAHDGQDMVVRLRWPVAEPHERDALALAFPVGANPSLATMGAADSPIHILHWRASDPGVRSVLATGIGSTRPGADIRRSAKVVWDGGMYQLTIARALGRGAGVAPLIPGSETKIGMAVWRGANDERAGLKAYSIDWHPLHLPA